MGPFWQRISWPARWAILAGVCVLLLYLPAVRYDLVWDDTIFLRDLPTYRDPALAWSALWQPFVLSPNYFRPLGLLTFVLELRLWGLQPAAFHLTNILLHAVNTALVTLLLARALPWREEQPWGNLLVPALGLLYGLHPVLIEGVAFISSRFDLLMTLFLLLAWWADGALAGRKLLRPLLVGLFFFLAALAKEMAVALLPALLCWHLSLQEGPFLQRLKQLRKHLWVYGAIVGAGLLYLGVRLLSIGYLLSTAPDAVVDVGPAGPHLLLVLKAAALYILLLLCPFPLLSPIHYGELPVPLNDPVAWVGLALLLLVGLGVGGLLRKTPQVGWSLLGGLLTLLPVLHIWPIQLGGGSLVAERYLLFPLVPLVLALARRPVWQRPAGPFPWRRVLLGGWLLAAVVTIQLTLPYWQSDMTLWTWASRRAPRSDLPATNLALEYVEWGQYEHALELAQRATELNPKSANAWDNLGLALFHLERYEEARSAFERATELEPKNALFWSNLAGALRELGDLGEAERILLGQALRLDPNLPVAYLNLGIVYLRADRPDLASLAFQQALRLLPPEESATAQHFLQQTQEPERWLRLGDLLLNSGDYEGALQAYSRAASLGASVADAAVGMSAALIQMQKWEQAAQVLFQALVVAPDDPRLHNNMGVVARELGDIATAREHFLRAIELAPDWDLPRQNLETLPDE